MSKPAPRHPTIRQTRRRFRALRNRYRGDSDRWSYEARFGPETHDEIRVKTTSRMTYIVLDVMI